MGYDIEFLAWVLLILVKGACTLRDVRLTAPEATSRGAPLALRCDYDMEDEPLYCVKWYRDDHEFARYSPRDVPPLKVFPVPGLDVDRAESDARRLSVASATEAGRFTCEVSAEAPSFHTMRVSAYVNIADFPSEDPVLLGLRESYKAGSKLKAECVSGRSSPPANLTFAVNDKLVSSSSKHVYHRVQPEEDGLLTAHATLQFHVQRHDFLDGKLKIRCTAHMFSTYRRSVQRTAHEHTRRDLSGLSSLSGATDTHVATAVELSVNKDYHAKRRKADRHQQMQSDSSATRHRISFVLPISLAILLAVYVAV